MCHFAAVPAWHHISRLTQHVAVDRVHVPCDAAMPGVFLPRLAAREAVRARPRHHELCVGGRCCANDTHQQLLAWSCSARLPRGQGANPPPPNRSSGCRARPRATMLPHVCLATQPSLLIVTRGDYHTRTTGSLERRAPLRPPTWQDASFSRRRRMYSESGGTRVPRRAPVALWSYRPLAGVVRGCARPVQRSVVYV